MSGCDKSRQEYDETSFFFIPCCQDLRSENTSVFKDSDFDFTYHLSTRRLKKRIQNQCPGRHKTFPKRSSPLVASWKHFGDGLGSVLDFQSRSLRRPRRSQKRILLIFASCDWILHHSWILFLFVVFFNHQKTHCAHYHLPLKK